MKGRTMDLEGYIETILEEVHSAKYHLSDEDYSELKKFLKKSI